jgi:hypothetical protein
MQESSVIMLSLGTRWLARPTLAQSECLDPTAYRFSENILT